MAVKQIWKHAWALARKETWALNLHEMHTMHPCYWQAIKLHAIRESQHIQENYFDALYPAARICYLRRKRLR